MKFSCIFSSDDGNFYIWDRKTTKLKSIYKADRAIVNCVQPHPFLPLIATSGIDHEIGLWTPQPDVRNFHQIFQIFRIFNSIFS